MMTSLIFRWALDPYNGAINVILHELGSASKMGPTPADWLGRPTGRMFWMMVVAIFVSLPFSTYAILAGLQTIPEEVYEAGRVDGAALAHLHLDHTAAAASGSHRRER